MKTVAKSVISNDLIKNNNVILILSSSKLYSNVNLKLLNQLTKSVDKGILVTINQPYTSIKGALSDGGVNVNKIFFIDMITATASNNPERSTDCLFINSPSDLTALGIALDQAIAYFKGSKFIFIDNFLTFLIYNNEKVMIEFSHYLISKMRLHNIKGFIMSTGGDGDNFISRIGSLFDEVIRLN